MRTRHADVLSYRGLVLATIPVYINEPQIWTRLCYAHCSKRY
jgi:hypothetical protein